MKNVGNFLIGSMSSLGVAQAIPDTVQTASEAPVGIIDSVEALVSLLSGILSTIIIAWLKRKWDSKPKANKV